GCGRQLRSRRERLRRQTGRLPRLRRGGETSRRVLGRRERTAAGSVTLFRLILSFTWSPQTVTASKSLSVNLARETSFMTAWVSRRAMAAYGTCRTRVNADIAPDGRALKGAFRIARTCTPPSRSHRITAGWYRNFRSVGL